MVHEYLRNDEWLYLSDSDAQNGQPRGDLKLLFTELEEYFDQR